MTKLLTSCGFGLAALLLLAGCSGPPAADLTPEPAATEAPTPEAIATPATRFATAVSGLAITSTSIITTSAAVTVPLATPTPGTPTAIPTPAPSAALLREAAALQEDFRALREAMAAGDTDGVLKAQRTLLDELPKAEAAATGDQSKAADSFRAALRALKSALNGDLAKLDSIDQTISDFLGNAPRPQSTVTASAATSVKPVTNLGQYAKDLAASIAAFQKAVGQGNVSDMLRLQKSLLDEMDRGDAALKTSRTKQSDLVRGAIEDLRNALGGDVVKFDSAQAKLLQAAEAVATGTGTTSRTGKQVDLQPLANDLHNRLDAYQHALDGKNKDDISKAQQALTDQVNKTQGAIKDDQSARAVTLRDALGAVREAASGDTAKMSAAIGGLEKLIGGQ